MLNQSKVNVSHESLDGKILLYQRFYLEHVFKTGSWNSTISAMVEIGGLTEHRQEVEIKEWWKL